MIQFLTQLEELQSLVTPEMKIYGHLVKAGFFSLLFDSDPRFLFNLRILEEIIKKTVEENSSSMIHIQDFSNF